MFVFTAVITLVAGFFLKFDTKSYIPGFLVIFILTFISMVISNFKELIKVGSGRPAIAYWLSQTANPFWTLLIVWLLWSGTFFTPAILPD